MYLNVSRDDCEVSIRADRDGVLNCYGNQGFDLSIGHLTIHFEDELDAVCAAREILTRMGIAAPKVQWEEKT